MVARHQVLSEACTGLQMMKTMEVSRIVYVSSGGTVYGNPSIPPVPASQYIQSDQTP